MRRSRSSSCMLEDSRRRSGAAAAEAATPGDRAREARARPLPEHLPREDSRPATRLRLPGLRRRADGLGEDVERDARVRAGALQGDPPRAAEAELRDLRDDRAGAGAHRARSSAAWPGPDCWRMCWSPSTPIICRSTGRARSTPARASSWSARRWPTGWAVRAGCSSRWSKRSAAMCWRPASCTPTTRRCRCSPGTRHDQDGPAVDLRARRPAGRRPTPPAVLFRYSPDRKGERSANSI